MAINLTLAIYYWRFVHADRNEVVNGHQEYVEMPNNRFVGV